MRKRVCVLGLLAIVLAISLPVSVAMLLPRQGVTRANFERIHIGMAYEDVKAILGEPNGWINPGHDNRMCIWDGYECSIRIEIAGNDVTSCECGDGRPDERTVWQKIRARAPWPLREEEDDIRLPTPHYLRHEPQYFPPSNSFPLSKELQSLEEAQRQFENEKAP